MYLGNSDAVPTKEWSNFFLKWANPSLFLFPYFRSFHIPIQMTNIQFEQ